MSYQTRTRFLDRTGARLAPAANKLWRCTLGQLSATGTTPHAAADALRALVVAPVSRVPVAPARWFTPR